MKIEFTYKAKVIKEYSSEEIIEDSQNERILEYFTPFETEIAEFIEPEIRGLSLSGGLVRFKKIDNKGSLGFVVSVGINRMLTSDEISTISSKLTDQVDELYFGPDGIYCDMGKYGCYVLPVHPSYAKTPINVEINENV